MSYIQPVKLLKVFVNNITPVSYWGGDITDPYNGYPYKWEYSISVDYQPHSSPDTLTPYYYNGLDINVGNWISTSVGGIALKIIEVVSSDENSAVLIVEDVERFNLINEDISLSSGGAGSTGEGIIFELADDGLPILGPIQPNYLPNTFITDLISRFRYRNNSRNYVRVYQENHQMNIGDVIRLDVDNNIFVKAVSDSNIRYVIGTVSSVNIPGKDWFTFKPLRDINENISPPLIGNYGDFFYVDPINPGKLTNQKPTSNARPIYMRLDNNRGLYLDFGSEGNETKRFDVNPISNQLIFVLPNETNSVLYMSINGIENSNYSFDPITKELIFDPITTGYGVDELDEVFFIYKT